MFERLRSFGVSRGRFDGIEDAMKFNIQVVQTFFEGLVGSGTDVTVDGVVQPFGIGSPCMEQAGLEFGLQLTKRGLQGRRQGCGVGSDRLSGRSGRPWFTRWSDGSLASRRSRLSVRPCRTGWACVSLAGCPNQNASKDGKENKKGTDFVQLQQTFTSWAP